MNISLSSGLGSRSLPANSVVGPFMEGSELLLVCESGGGKPIPQVTRQSSETPSHRSPARVQKTHPTGTPARVQKTHPTDNTPEFREPIPQVARQSSENPSHRYTPPEFRKPIPQVTPPEFRKPIPHRYPFRVQKTSFFLAFKKFKNIAKSIAGTLRLRIWSILV